jgi:hypothetical protein
MQVGHSYKIPNGAGTGSQFVIGTITAINTTTPSAFIITFSPDNSAVTLPSITSGNCFLFHGIASYTGSSPITSTMARSTTRDYNVFETSLVEEVYTSSAAQYQNRVTVDTGLYGDFARNMFGSSMPNDALANVSGDNALSRPLIDFGLRAMEGINSRLIDGERTQLTTNGQRKDTMGGIQQACIQGGGIITYNQALPMIDTFIDLSKRLENTGVSFDSYVIMPGIGFRDKLIQDMSAQRATLGVRVPGIEKNIFTYAEQDINQSLNYMFEQALEVYHWGSKNFTMMTNFAHFDSLQEFGASGFSRSFDAFLMPCERMNSSGLSGEAAAPYRLILPTNAGGDTQKYTLLDSRGKGIVNFLSPVVRSRGNQTLSQAVIELSIMSEFSMTFLGKEGMFQLEPA